MMPVAVRGELATEVPGAAGGAGRKVAAEVVLHLQLTFPQTYPCQPPTLLLFTPLSHPNVFTHPRRVAGCAVYRVCLDMLEESSSTVQYSGWSSSYTVASMLTQLQCTSCIADCSGLLHGVIAMVLVGDAPAYDDPHNWRLCAFNSCLTSVPV